jgi:integrase
MARELNRLTALEVKNAQPGEKPNTPRLLSDGGGLYLQITPQGSKSFLFRYTFGGKPQVVGLGATHSVSLADARKTAESLRALVLQGIDPKVQRAREKASRQSAATATVRWCGEQYILAHQKDWKNEKHVHQWRQTLKDYVYPKIGDKPVRDIDVHDVMAVLKPIWETKTETATRVRGRLERVLGWATVNGYRAGDNPARWKAYLSELLAQPGKVAKVEHHRAIPHRDLHQFIARLRQQPSTVASLALEFLILTAARTNEVIAAEWSEFNIEEKAWAIPAERMKSKRPHIVPLSERALEILRSIPKLPDEKYVFRGINKGKHISNMAMLQLMRRMKVDAVPHGMRSAFRDWAADMTDFPRELAEAALAHVVGDKTEAAYLRTDRLQRRRVMMEAWAAYCAPKNH